MLQHQGLALWGVMMNDFILQAIDGKIINSDVDWKNNCKIIDSPLAKRYLGFDEDACVVETGYTTYTIKLKYHDINDIHEPVKKLLCSNYLMLKKETAKKLNLQNGNVFIDRYEENISPIDVCNYVIVLLRVQ